jgi:hypothetical protein
MTHVHHCQRLAVFSTPLDTPCFRSSLQEPFMAIIMETNLQAYYLQAFFYFFYLPGKERGLPRKIAGGK